MFKQVMMYGATAWANNLLVFLDEVKLNKYVLAYKQFHGNCPLYIKEMLTSNADIQTRSSRCYKSKKPGMSML